MKPTYVAGISLGIAVALWSLIFTLSGLYKNPSLGLVFILGATAIQIGAIVWGLKKTVLEGRRYGGQFGAGMLISVVGLVIIVLFSIVLTSVIIPDYYDEVAAMSADAWADAGMSADEVDDLLDKTEFMRTPVAGAVTGGIGTLITGLVVSLITAAVVRVKD